MQKYMYNETRFTMLAQAHPAAAKVLLDAAQKDVQERWKLYEQLAGQKAMKDEGGGLRDGLARSLIPQPSSFIPARAEVKS